MDCRWKLLSYGEVCPVTDPRELLTLSYSDIRRIAAIKATDRLKQLLKLQAKKIPKGTMTLPSNHDDSIIQTVSFSDISIIVDTWTYFVEYKDYYGVRLLIRLLNNEPNLIKLFPRLDTGRRRRCFLPLTTDNTAIQYGRSLILHITGLIANLRNNRAMEDYIRVKVGLLHKAGLERSVLSKHHDEVLHFLEESHPDKWSYTVSAAWITLIHTVATFANTHWLNELAHDKERITSCKPRIRFKTPETQSEDHSVFTRSSASQ